MLSAELASAFAGVALANVEREYPRRLDQLLVAPGAEWRPRVLHPAFYGSYDWHSAVHMHWLLAFVLRLHAGIALRERIESVLDRHLNHEAMAKEREFFDRPGGAIFERPYGWAWLLKLQAELLRLGRWHDPVAPLASELARRLILYLRSSPYPVRSGAHGNTAFACVLALDYAQASGDGGLSEAIEEAARRWYFNDRNYAVAYEPSADDFLSPALVEAVMMKSVLSAAEFSPWLERFLPQDLGPLTHPPRVSNHADAKQSHLDGLCLSRAWCFTQLEKTEEAKRHLEAGMPHVLDGDYVGEHWLASFAALALSAGVRKTP